PQAMAANLIRSSLFAYNQAANRYDAATSIQPFLGYWIYVDPKVSMGLPVTIRFDIAGVG
nr:hypothetical protein [Armatimonadota bacterium]